MMNLPLVTVFMAMYNGEKYVLEAVKSVLNQAYQNFELLIIDDGSTDNSLSIVSAIKDPRVRVLRNESNMGLYRTRNRGLAEARGEYFSILDCDDVAEPERFTAPVAFLEKNSQYAACFGLYRLIDSNGRTLPAAHMFAGDHEWISVLAFFMNPFINSTLVIRKSVIQHYAYRTGFEPVEDYDLMQRIVKENRVHILDKKTVKYRIHNSNSSNIQADKGAKGLKLVIADLLKPLLGEVTEEDIDLHYALQRKILTGTGYNIKDMERWLLLVLERNNERKIYPVELFRKAIQLEWARVIYNNKSAGNISGGIKSPLFGAQCFSYLFFLTLRGIKQRVGMIG